MPIMGGVLVYDFTISGYWIYLFYIYRAMRQGSSNQSNHSNRRGRGQRHNNHHNSNPRRHSNHSGNNRNQNFDSNGPQGRIRGNAKQIYEKYLQQAKDAISAGDRVLAESLHQHADHYGRIAALNAPKPKPVEEAAPEVTEVATETTTEETPLVEAVEAKSEAVAVEIQDGDDAEVEAKESVVEEKPKPKRRTPVRRAARKRIEEDAPKLGGGTNAVPDFLARPVDVEEATSETPAAEEKPKRRAPRKTAAPRKTTTTRTRRKKADEAVDGGTEKEAS